MTLRLAEHLATHIALGSYAAAVKQRAEAGLFERFAPVARALCKHRLWLVVRTKKPEASLLPESIIARGGLEPSTPRV